MFHPELSTSAVMTHEPASYAANTHEGADVDMLGFDTAIVYLLAGVATATGTLDVKIQEKEASGDSYADALDDADTPAVIAFPQIVAANDKQLLVGVLRRDRRKRFITPVAVVAVDAVIFATAVVPCNARDAKFSAFLQTFAQATGQTTPKGLAFHV